MASARSEWSVLASASLTSHRLGWSEPGHPGSVAGRPAAGQGMEVWVVAGVQRVVERGLVQMVG